MSVASPSRPSPAEGLNTFSVIVFPLVAQWKLAAIDRLVHCATILEMNVESYRRKAALKRKHGPGD
jgi:hypothetical protein